MEKYIRVTGKGQIAVKPDLIRLNIQSDDIQVSDTVTVVWQIG